MIGRPPPAPGRLSQRRCAGLRSHRDWCQPISSRYCLRDECSNTRSSRSGLKLCGFQSWCLGLQPKTGVVLSLLLNLPRLLARRALRTAVPLLLILRMGGGRLLRFWFKVLNTNSEIRTTLSRARTSGTDSRLALGISLLEVSDRHVRQPADLHILEQSRPVHHDHVVGARR
jgi:hypothetical protein